MKQAAEEQDTTPGNKSVMDCRAVFSYSTAAVFCCHASEESSRWQVL